MGGTPRNLRISHRGLRPFTDPGWVTLVETASRKGRHVTSPRLVALWETAAQKLGFEIEAPYRLTLPSGHSIDAVVLVRGFGDRIGMLVIDDYRSVEQYQDEIIALGYGYSVMGEPSEASINDPTGMTDVLRDWDWFGPDEERPSWLDAPPQE